MLAPLRPRPTPRIGSFPLAPVRHWLSSSPAPLSATPTQGSSWRLPSSSGRSAVPRPQAAPRRHACESKGHPALRTLQRGGPGRGAPHLPPGGPARWAAPLRAGRALRFQLRAPSPGMSPRGLQAWNSRAARGPCVLEPILSKKYLGPLPELGTLGLRRHDFPSWMAGKWARAGSVP